MPSPVHAASRVVKRGLCSGTRSSCVTQLGLTPARKELQKVCPAGKLLQEPGESAQAALASGPQGASPNSE
jgi:hypothetical protein